ncbi:GNAT family N-acetyltransferase [Vibrio parahaemolyticus]|nr:GNAT family N-acetyltransferase [Vibrio parahaemolyticus]
MKLEFCLNPDQADLDCVRDGIRSYNRKHLPEGEVNAVGCFAKDEDGKIIGGLTGEMLEQHVKPYGVSRVYLDTYSFQALDFYLKLGFEKVGQYSGYPAEGIHKYFLQKEIAD